MDVDGRILGPDGRSKSVPSAAIDVLTLPAHLGSFTDVRARAHSVQLGDLSISIAHREELRALLGAMSDADVARAWAQCMKELQARDLIRTANTPVGDYAERVCCEALGLRREGFSAKGIDAVGPDGVRYQIKGRRLTPTNPSRQLGAIRDIRDKPFDVLLAVFFDEDLELLEIWRIPHEVVAEAQFVARTNSTRFVLTAQVRQDRRVERLV